jgi:hypothetical protein
VFALWTSFKPCDVFIQTVVKTLLPFRWLLKGNYGAATEQLILAQDIEEFTLKSSAVRRMWKVAFTSGIVGGLVVWVLTEVLPTLIRSWIH